MKREFLRARSALATVNLEIAHGTHGDYWSASAMAALLAPMHRYVIARYNYVAVFGEVVS